MGSRSGGEPLKPSVAPAARLSRVEGGRPVVRKITERLSNQRMRLAALPAEAAGSLRSPAASVDGAPQLIRGLRQRHSIALSTCKL